MPERMGKRLAALAVVALLPAVAYPQGPQPAAPAQCLGVQVASSGGTGGRPGTRFSATQTGDLSFQALLAHSLAGEHVLELRVFTPHGFLYRSISVPIAVGPAGAAFRRVPRYPFPLRVVSAAEFFYQNANVLRVDVPFPVGGTDIVSSSLYGQWRVAGYLDDPQHPCGGPGQFVLTQ